MCLNLEAGIGESILPKYDAAYQYVCRVQISSKSELLFICCVCSLQWVHTSFESKCRTVFNIFDPLPNIEYGTYHLLIKEQCLTSRALVKSLYYSSGHLHTQLLWDWSVVSSRSFDLFFKQFWHRGRLFKPKPANYAVCGDMQYYGAAEFVMGAGQDTSMYSIGYTLLVLVPCCVGILSQFYRLITIFFFLLYPIIWVSALDFIGVHSCTSVLVHSLQKFILPLKKINVYIYRKRSTFPWILFVMPNTTSVEMCFWKCFHTFSYMVNKIEQSSYEVITLHSFVSIFLGRNCTLTFRSIYLIGRIFDIIKS